jgi:hypothetical protein
MQSILLLPERRRFAGQSLSAEFAKRLGCAVRLSEGQAGERAQLERYFTLQPHGWPMAAIQRRFDAGDADKFVWLRADPVHCRADMAGVRLLAWGNLAIDDEEASSFLTALQPIFVETGLQMSATAPDRWFLRIPPGMELPAFGAPDEVLGADLFEYLPQGDAGRRWRTLLSESQVILHNHPANADRLARGQQTVNSVWFWGGGAMPESITTSVGSVDTPDPELQALFALSAQSPSASNLCDLRHVRDWSMVEKRLYGEPLALLDFADGLRWNLEPSQRWRFWRRPLRRLDT